MNSMSGAHEQSPASVRTRGTAHVSLTLRTDQHDYIPVPRCVLERLLTHARAGYRRFPTRHLHQIIASLQHLLGITD